jgi:hypothetical protein
MSGHEDALSTDDFATIWRALTTWEQRRARLLDLPGCRVQLYMGAMEIPMLALRPATPVSPEAERLATWQPTLDRFGLVLDCVTPDANYKLNRHASGEYVGRILPDALKFHAARVIDLGSDALEELCRSYLALAAAKDP